MIKMALHGNGEPQPTLLQVATQAATVELFKQWQTYRNGVHMDWDTFRSIDFRAVAVAVLTGAGFEVKQVDATLQLPTLGDDLNATVRPEVTLAGTTTRRASAQAYGLPAEVIAEHGKQVQG